MSEESNTPSESHKYSPSISQLIDAAKRLPDPKIYDKRTYSTFITGSKGKQLEFERIKLVKPDGTKVSKWSFKGRITIDSKYLTEVEE